MSRGSKERTTVPPLRVVFASVHAGGGHNTVRDALVRSVTRQDPGHRRILPITWTAANGFDTFYRFCVRWHLQGLVFWLTNFMFSAWLATLLNPRLMLELLALLKAQKPDVVISTHIQLTACFQVARLLLRSKTRVVNVIPDYGEPTPTFFPPIRWLRADATLVNGKDTYELVAPKGAQNEVFRLGTLVTEAFDELGTLETRSASAKEQWKRELAEAVPDFAYLDTSKPVVTFFGGSGFSSGSRPIIERLLRHPELGHAFSIVVLAGRDAQFETELLTLHAGKPGFVVSGFLPHRLLSRLYALTDVPVMGSIAHSTLQEMLEMRCGPLLVFRVIPGTEPPYITFLEHHRLGLYQPDEEAMEELVLEGVGLRPASLKWRSLKKDFAGKAMALRKEHKRLAPLLISDIEFISGRSTTRILEPVVSRRTASYDEIPRLE